MSCIVTEQKCLFWSLVITKKDGDECSRPWNGTSVGLAQQLRTKKSLNSVFSNDGRHFDANNLHQSCTLIASSMQERYLQERIRLIGDPNVWNADNFCKTIASDADVRELLRHREAIPVKFGIELFERHRCQYGKPHRPVLGLVLHEEMLTRHEDLCAGPGTHESRFEKNVQNGGFFVVVLRLGMVPQQFDLHRRHVIIPLLSSDVTGSYIDAVRPDLVLIPEQEKLK